MYFKSHTKDKLIQYKIEISLRAKDTKFMVEVDHLNELQKE